MATPGIATSQPQSRPGSDREGSEEQLSVLLALLHAGGSHSPALMASSPPTMLGLGDQGVQGPAAEAVSASLCLERGKAEILQGSLEQPSRGGPKVPAHSLAAQRDFPEVPIIRSKYPSAMPRERLISLSTHSKENTIPKLLYEETFKKYSTKPSREERLCGDVSGCYVSMLDFWILLWLGNVSVF